MDTSDEILETQRSLLLEARINSLLSSFGWLIQTELLHWSEQPQVQRKYSFDSLTRGADCSLGCRATTESLEDDDDEYRLPYSEYSIEWYRYTGDHRICVSWRRETTHRRIPGIHRIQSGERSSAQVTLYVDITSNLTLTPLCYLTSKGRLRSDERRAFREALKMKRWMRGEAEMEISSAQADALIPCMVRMLLC